MEEASTECRSHPGDELALDEKLSAGPVPPGLPPGPFRLTSPDTSFSVPLLADELEGPRYRVPWAELLRKVFAIDVLECPRCQGRLEIVAFIAEPTVARRILDHLGLASQAPPIERARAPDELPDGDPGPDYATADPIYDE